MREDVKLSIHVSSGLDRHRFDVNTDLDSDSTFHFDAISALDPDLYKIRLFLLLFTAVPVNK